MKNAREITIEDIYEVAEFLIVEEFHHNTLGEKAENVVDLRDDREWFNAVQDANIDDETVDSVFETKVDVLIDCGILRTRYNSDYMIWEVEFVTKEI